MTGSRTEYRRRIKFSCPVCLHSFTKETWVHDLKELNHFTVQCPVCGSATLRIDSEDDDIEFFVYRNARQEINEMIEHQQEENYDYN